MLEDGSDYRLCEEIGCKSIAGWRIDAGIGVRQYACTEHVGCMMHTKNYSVVVPIDGRTSDLDDVFVPTLGTPEERLRITMDAAIRYFREYRKLRSLLHETEKPAVASDHRVTGEG